MHTFMIWELLDKVALGIEYVVRVIALCVLDMVLGRHPLL